MYVHNPTGKFQFKLAMPNSFSQVRKHAFAQKVPYERHT